MDQSAVLTMAAIVGWLLNWLRGLPKFNDGETLAICAAGGIISALLGSPDLSHVRPLLLSMAVNTVTILGGVGASNMVTHIGDGKILSFPKFNQYTSAPTPEVKK